MFSKILKWVLAVQILVFCNFSAALDLEKQFQEFINLERGRTIERTEIVLPHSKVTISPTEETITIFGDSTEFNGVLLSYGKSFNDANKEIKTGSKPALNLEPVCYIIHSILMILICQKQNIRILLIVSQCI